ncbi:chymotrypsin-like [Coccinella septempunctata]|uniref:chymotrypsin-like n=1 Tax=Coccinella septempunctata TaxID=41139 RepID=UPI001D07BE34|nr:chymotrypsin-like [Coccinella septempunctata]
MLKSFQKKPSICKMFIIYCIFLALNAQFLNAHEFSYPQDRAANTKLRIIGGNEAIPHSIGYQVGIRIEQSEITTFCGGSLITSSYVLTAAHCLRDVVSLEVILGAHNISKREWVQVRLTPKNYTIHPEWDLAHLTNDIALIKLPKPVKTGLFIKTVALPKGDNDDYSGDTALLSGWGMTKYNDTIPSTLQYATSTILSNKDCRKIEPFGKVIEDTHLCLSSRGRISSCDGDSGGPLVVEGVQVGVVSFTIKQCKLTKPSVFTRVSKYLDWIEANSDWNRKKATSR